MNRILGCVQLDLTRLPHSHVWSKTNTVLSKLIYFNISISWLLKFLLEFFYICGMIVICNM